jgi:putative sigma-54 modulation protein
MNVDYTARQYEITPLIRKQVESGLGKITKMLGENFDSKVILVGEKHRYKAEITVTVRKRPIVGVAEAADMTAAVGEALDRIEVQAIKHRTRWKALKRKSTKKWVAAESPQEELRMAVGASATTAVPVVVHNYPHMSRTTEAHVSRSTDAVALRPMTLEEAVKEAEFRDRDVFVFRDAKGKVKVLHRKKDGKMELIEAP